LGSKKVKKLSVLITNKVCLTSSWLTSILLYRISVFFSKKKGFAFN